MFIFHFVFLCDSSEFYFSFNHAFTSLRFDIHFLNDDVWIDVYWRFALWRNLESLESMIKIYSRLGPRRSLIQLRFWMRNNASIFDSVPFWDGDALIFGFSLAFKWDLHRSLIQLRFQTQTAAGLLLHTALFLGSGSAFGWECAPTFGFICVPGMRPATGIWSSPRSRVRPCWPRVRPASFFKSAPGRLNLRIFMPQMHLMPAETLITPCTGNELTATSRFRRKLRKTLVEQTQTVFAARGEQSFFALSSAEAYFAWGARPPRLGARIHDVTVITFVSYILFGSMAVWTLRKIFIEYVPRNHLFDVDLNWFWLSFSKSRYVRVSKESIWTSKIENATGGLLARKWLGENRFMASWREYASRDQILEQRSFLADQIVKRLLVKSPHVGFSRLFRRGVPGIRTN